VVAVVLQLDFVLFLNFPRLRAESLYFQYPRLTLFETSSVSPLWFELALGAPSNGFKLTKVTRSGDDTKYIM